MTIHLKYPIVLLLLVITKQSKYWILGSKPEDDTKECQGLILESQVETWDRPDPSDNNKNDAFFMPDHQLIQHLAIIMDGNRRWAKERGLPGYMGHEQGYETLKKVSTHVFSRGIRILTVFAFSTENWNRTKKEIDILLLLFRKAIQEQFGELSKNGIQLRFIGDISAFPNNLQKEMEHLMKETEKNTRGILNVALNYGGRQEIMHAIRRLMRADIRPEDITEQQVSDNLFTGGFPDPELFIRTSGEQRLSGFLPWQTVYSELYFLEKYWPDMTAEDIDRACDAYAQRQRRFGA